MKIRWFIPIIPLIALFLALAGGFAVVWQLFLLITVVFCLSLAWSLISYRRVSVRVSAVPDQCQVGEKLEEEFHLENTSRIPAAVVEVREITDMPAYRNVRTFSLPGGSSRVWRTAVTCTRRGSYSLGALKVTVSDPLGLFPRYVESGRINQVLVLPRTYELPHFEVIPRRVAGWSQRRWMASEVGTSASKVREYTSGDSLRHVHWPTTAHSGRLMVKEFDPERSFYTFRHVWLALDMHGGRRYGRGDETTEEYAITTTASLVRKFIRDGKDVGLVAAGDHSVLHLPAWGTAQEDRILHSLAVLRDTGNIPLPELLNVEAERFEAGTAVIVIMPSVQQDILTPLRRALSRGVFVAVVLLDIASFGGPDIPGPDIRRFEGAGLNVYTIRRGDHIAGALDSRFMSLGATTGIGVV